MNEPNSDPHTAGGAPSWPDPLPESLIYERGIHWVTDGAYGRLAEVAQQLAELEARVAELERVVRRVEAIGVEVRELIDRG